MNFFDLVIKTTLFATRISASENNGPDVYDMRLCNLCDSVHCFVFRSIGRFEATNSARAKGDALA